MESIDTVVIGAGVVGLACAHSLARDGREVVVIERETAFGTGISARNSEVIHAGLYYPQGSLKARLCVRGRAQLYEFCASHGVAHRRCGKLVVATSAEQHAALDATRAKAAANGVELQWLTPAEAAALEPALRCSAALLSPETGIVDSHGLMLALQGDMEAAGGALALCSPVLGLRCAADARDAGDAGDGHVVAVGGDGILVAGLDHDRAVKAGLLLEAGMAVVPVGAVLLHGELVTVGPTRVNPREAEPRDAIHVGGQQDAVPVDRRVFIEAVRHVQRDRVALTPSQQGTGQRIIDGERRPGCAGDVDLRLADAQVELGASEDGRFLPLARLCPERRTHHAHARGDAADSKPLHKRPPGWHRRGPNASITSKHETDS